VHSARVRAFENGVIIRFAETMTRDELGFFVILLTVAGNETTRMATPVTVFQRTALDDLMVGEQEVRKGQRIGLFYASASFDSDVSEEPECFDMLRTPNPHVAFGGHGAHYCIGAHLARMEIEPTFNQIADTMPDIPQAGEPRRLRHGWTNGIEELQVTYR
jgi:cholest-4-en-3-one 26-monooxygenase